MRTCRRCGCTESDCSGCIAWTGSPRHWVDVDLCSACSPVVLPDAITPAIAAVLGLPNFRVCPLADIYRAAGHHIARKVEAEQAFILHRFLPLAILHGDSWKVWADGDVEATLAAVKARAESATSAGDV